MNTATLLLFVITASSGEIEFNSRPRNFSVDLLYHTLDLNDHFAISPFPLWLLVIGFAYGAKGSTFNEMSNVFRLPEDREEAFVGYDNLRTSIIINVRGVVMKYYTSFIYDNNVHISSDAMNHLKNKLQASTRRLNFDELDGAAIPTRWRHLIRSEDFKDSAMIMCNYFYFRAEWSTPFRTSDSYIEYIKDGNITGKTEILYQIGQFPFSNFESLHASVTELPYGPDGKYCMLLIRPHEGYSLKQVSQNLRNVSLKDILAKLQKDVDEFGLQEVTLKLPKFAMDLRVRLNKPLFNMGLSDVFDPNLSDFNEFAGESIFISEISQKVQLLITEAVTLLHATIPSMVNPTPIKETAARNPFIFLIMEKTTATILVAGSYSKVTLN